MAKKAQKKKKTAAKPAAPQPKDFLDMVAPTAVKFNTDHAIVGGVYRSFMAIRGYPATTESLALLRHLGEKSGVNLTVYARKVTAAEEKQIICLDPEHELIDLCDNLGGCFVDLMDGRYRINPLEPKAWSVDEEEPGDDNDPAAFRQRTLLSQHISFLKDFFRSYKDFTDAHIDTIELMLERLYAKWGIDDSSDFSSLFSGQYPILSDLYDVIENAYQHYEDEANPLYPKELLREVLLGLHSLCRGAESKFFNGHTTVITDFSDLDAVGRAHYMNLHDGCASMEELEALDGYETALLLIDGEAGAVTPYGVVYDNGMKLDQIYDGRHFPAYDHDVSLIALSVVPKTAGSVSGEQIRYAA